MDRSLTLASPRGPTDSLKMKEKDRQAIKDKFAGFNKAMEEILRYIVRFRVKYQYYRKYLEIFHI